MEGRNHIPPTLLNLRQTQTQPQPRTHQPHFIIGDIPLPLPTTVVRHQQLQHLLMDNQRLAATHVALLQELSAAREHLRHVSAAAVKVKEEREAEVREVNDKVVKMEAEVKLVGELSVELVNIINELRKLRLENKELGQKLTKVCDDVVNVSEDWKRFSVAKSDIETMQKEIQRGRAVIEHEKRVHASNIKQSKTMEKYKILMAGEIKKLQVEVIDAGKRARAAAAAEV